MKTLSTALMLALFATASLHTVSVRADDTATQKAEDAGSDAKMNTKKTARHAKKKVRKATNNDTMGKDVKDSASDAKDSATNTKEKMEHKGD